MSANFLYGTLTSATLTPLAIALANHLWQSTVVACIAGLLTLTLRRNHARARYALWLAASIKFLVPFSLLMVLGAHLASLRPATPRHPAPADSLLTIQQINQPFNLAPTRDAAPRPAAPVATPSIAARLAAVWNRSPLLPASLAAVWLIGFLTVSIRWTMRWRRIAAAIQLTAPLDHGREFEILQRMRHLTGLHRTIELHPLPASMEPGIFGLIRPVLLWPDAIATRLEDTHLEAVLAHEVCHVRRRDNLTAALHMVVEALFWFHPLVWWLETRLVEERERACDEEVLQLCGHRRIYAESILKVCEFCVESPLACVSGVTGADLKRRIVQILADRAVLKLTLTKKLLLATTAILVVAVPIVLGQANGAQRRMLAAIHEETVASNSQLATTIADDVQRAEFEVATVRPSNPNNQNYGFQADGHNIFYENERVVDLIAFAYGLRPSQVARAPEWVDKERYDIRGIANQPNEPTTKQQQHMLRKLLEERFQFKSHPETREMPVYVMTIAKGGPKLTKSPSGDYAMGDETTRSHGTQTILQFKHATLSDFAMNLSYYVDRPVLDHTNLQGRYDFDLRYTSDETHSTDPDASPGLFTAVQEQMGVKLDAVKAQADVVVIDGIEKPGLDGADGARAPSAVPVAMVQEKATLPDATVAATASHPAFEVATIKPSSSQGKEGMGMDFLPGGNVNLTNVPAYELVEFAYGVPYQSPRMSGGPEWAHAERYDIVAKAPEGAVPAGLTTKERNSRIRLMVQALLVERFKLSVSSEVKDVPVYNLVVGKGGPKLQPSKATPSDCMPGARFDGFACHQLNGGQGRGLHGTAVNVADIVQFVESWADRPMVDKTGLTGLYAIDTEGWVPMRQTGSMNPNAPNGDEGLSDPLRQTLFGVFQALGLKLEPATAPTEVYTINRMERPSEN